MPVLAWRFYFSGESAQATVHIGRRSAYEDDQTKLYLRDDRAAMMSSACRPRSEPEPVVDGVWPAERVVLYEGLPHPAWESELLEEQLRTKETQELHGHPFYKETLPLKLDDSKRLTDILGSAGTYKRFSGEKKCGGFHPDFVVEWHVGEDRFRVLICFGCRGKVIRSANRVSLRFRSSGF